MVVPHHQICGHEYQEASDGPAVHVPCECGTDSIGTCKRCGRRICGMHSQVSDGYRVCAWCRAEEQSNEEQLRQQHEGAKARELLQQIIQSCVPQLIGFLVLVGGCCGLSATFG